MVSEFSDISDVALMVCFNHCLSELQNVIIVFSFLYVYDNQTTPQKEFSVMLCK